MANTAKVVIGANYGDEGKGLMTDYFAAQAANSVVVRFNGGCQAGHTVTTPDGRRHVFSHFSSGTFAGAATFLSKDFAVNPVLYFKERPVLLAACGRVPTLYVDARAPVTTFYDMLLNQMVEDFRGAKRHGSCGMGFGETIGRTETGEFAVTVADLASTPELEEKLKAIRAVYIPERALELGLPADYLASNSKWGELLHSDTLIQNYIEAACRFMDEAIFVAPRFLLSKASNIVMEGAQGLMLDQNRGDFPYVTRSNTGLTNALEVAREAGLTNLDVTYVTRAYLTRHGAGPLANELGGKPYAGVEDRTNMPNQYQGSLRFAYLDADLLARSILRDLVECQDGTVALTAGLAVSCLDQLGTESAKLWSTPELLAKSRLEEGDRDWLLARLNRILPVSHVSYGPTRATIQETAVEVWPFNEDLAEAM